MQQTVLLSGVTLPAAAAAGATSFLSPCVLPLVPAYVGFLGQAASHSEQGTPRHRRLNWRVIRGALGFSLGLGLFLLTFFYAFDRLLAPYKQLALPILGGLVIVAGLGFIGLFRIPLLNREARWLPSNFRGGGFPAGFLLGLGFAAGWTPCIGPVLGAVLTSGLEQGATQAGMVDMAVYCVGLGAPFVVVALLIDRAGPLLARLNRHQHLIEVVGGLLVVGMGVLVVADSVTVLNGWFSAHLPSWFQDPFDL